MQGQKPSVGRVVHYYDEDGEGPYAAMVTRVDNPGNGRVTLACIDPDTATAWPQVGVLPGAPGQPQTWNWPPRT